MQSQPPQHSKFEVSIKYPVLHSKEFIAFDERGHLWNSGWALSRKLWTRRTKLESLRISTSKTNVKILLESQPNFPCKSQIQAYNVSSCLNSCPTCLIDLGLGRLHSNRSQFLLWRTQTDIFIMLSQSSKLGHYQEKGNIPMQHIPLCLPP